MITLKKIVKFLWPILLRAFLLEIEREIQHKLYGKGYSSKTAKRQIRSALDERRNYHNVASTPKSNDKVNPLTLVFDEDHLAKEVLDETRELIDTYGHVAVADVLEMVDRTYNHVDNHVDNHWGWKQDSAPIVLMDDDPMHPGKTVLNFPRPVYLR